MKNFALTLFSLYVAFNVATAHSHENHMPSKHVPAKEEIKPQLVLNDAPVCEALLSHSIQVSRGEQTLSYPPNLFYKRQTRGTVVNINEKTIHVNSFKHFGCKGTCNEYQLLASTEAFPSYKSDEAFYAKKFEASPPKAPRVHLLEDKSGNFYGLVLKEELEELHTLNDKAQWKIACRIAKATAPIKVLDPK